MKTQTKSKSSLKRIIIITALTLALVLALVGVSYAWIRNYIEVNSPELKTGKMLYNFSIYRKNASGGVDKISLYDTTPDGIGETDDSVIVLLDDEKAKIDITVGEELFFVIEKYDESINFDASISFDTDGLYDDKPETYDYVGQFEFAMKDDSASIASVTDRDGLDNYIKNPGENNAKKENFANIWNMIQETKFAEGSKYAVVRLFVKPLDDLSVQATGLTLPIGIKLCVAQEGHLPTNEATTTHTIVDKDTLETAINNYKHGDEFYINGSFEYTGDLVFTKPCKITLMRSTLTVKGNIIFSYMYDGDFTVNTVGDGHIVLSKNEGAAGSMTVDIPNASIKFLGANNSADGKADIYIENEFKVNASKNDDEGITFNARICDGTPSDSSGLKEIFVNGSSRIYNSLRTEIGKIHPTRDCKKIVIENYGTISAIYLRDMQANITMLTSPAIDINNCGNLVDDVIRLPLNSKKYDPDDTEDFADNVRIIAGKGCSSMRATVTENNNIFSLAPDKIHEYFFSNGNGGVEVDGYRDDIIYDERTVFVEKVDNDPTKVIIHYEDPSSTKNPDGIDIGDGTMLGSSLSTYLQYYSSDNLLDQTNRIETVDKLVDVTIICYGDKVLTPDDYLYIRTNMKSLVDLDISEAVSENKTVPEGAFYNYVGNDPEKNPMKNLTNVKMSESDEIWSQDIFKGTNVTEIWFPASLKKLDNPFNTSTNAYSSQKVLENIKYVHTSITIPEGMYLNTTSTQYFFVPDEIAYAEYRDYYNKDNLGNKFKESDLIDWYDRIFMDADRYGDYFLRLHKDPNNLNNTCEFVTYGGNFVASNESLVFDFKTIRVDGYTYTITSYDPFALYMKIVNDIVNEIEFGTDLETIGEYAFACNTKDSTKSSGILNVVFLGDTQIMQYAFYQDVKLETIRAENIIKLPEGNHFNGCSKLKEFYMPRLKSVEETGSLVNCTELQSIHISVIEKTTANQTFYSSTSKTVVARFYIHTEYADSPDSYIQGLAANNKFIFVHEDYAHLYKATSTYTGLADMEAHYIDELKEAGADGNPVSENNPLAYYYVTNGDYATLVACLLSNISDENVTYTTISSFNDGTKSYTINKIGSSAYQFTTIKAKEIKISDSVSEVGSYSFYANSNKKYCITFNLNNVKIAYDNALREVSMARLIGYALEEVRENTIYNSTDLVIVELPKLSRSREIGSTATVSSVFGNCKNLRILYVGISSDINYDTSHSTTNSYIRFINFPETYSDTNILSVPNNNTVINLNRTELFNENNSVTYGGRNFENIVFSDWYQYEGAIQGMEYSFDLPMYVYSDLGDGNLKLLAVSTDFVCPSDEYITPNELYLTGNVNPIGRVDYTVEKNGVSQYKITVIGEYAYGYVTLNSEKITIGHNTVEICFGAFRKQAYTKTTTAVLNYVNVFDLQNVEILGSECCYESKFEELISPKLKTINNRSFYKCTKLKNVYMPSYVSCESNYAFEGSTALEEITLGKYSDKLGSFMFKDCSSLSKINILRNDRIIEISTTLYLFANNTTNNNYAKSVSVNVQQNILDEYITAYGDKTVYKNGFGGVPVDSSHFKSFGYAHNDEDLIYYWDVVTEPDGGVGGKANINYIGGTIIPETVKLPSVISYGGSDYTVVSVSAAAIGALEGATSITLPDNMQKLSFSGADLPTTLTELVISGDNIRFKTESGVLYSKDGATLFIYPKAKADTAYTVDPAVTSIAKEAFYDVDKLETLTVKGVVKISDRAFAESSILKIVFENATASRFEGEGILIGANTELQIIVPVGTLESYKNNVWYDDAVTKIIDALKEAT